MGRWEDLNFGVVVGVEREELKIFRSPFSSSDLFGDTHRFTLPLDYPSFLFAFSSSLTISGERLSLMTLRRPIRSLEAPSSSAGRTGGGNQAIPSTLFPSSLFCLFPSFSYTRFFEN